VFLRKYLVLLATVLALLYAASSFAQTSSSNLQRDYLLSELNLSARFNVAYPLANITYGYEYTFDNAGWRQFITANGAPWRIMWDKRTGRPNLIEGKGIPFYAGKGNQLEKDYDSLSISYLHTKILAFAKQYDSLLRLDFSSLKLNEIGSHIFENGRYSVIQYDYYMNNVAVKGGRAFFRFNNGNLIQFGSLGISDVKITTIPAIDARQAENNVIIAFSDENREIENISDVQLKVVPEIPDGIDPYAEEYTGQEGYGLTYRLVWTIQFKLTNSIESYEAWVDAANGKIVNHFSLIEYGHVYGDISIRPDNRAFKVFPYCTVSNNGTKNTNFWGNYSYSSSPSTTASAALDGQYFNINDTCGSILLSTTLSPGNLNFGESFGTDCDTPGVGGAGNTYPSRSTFWHANLIRRKAYYFLSGIPWLTSNVIINTNRTELTCNAWWDSDTGTLNFVKSDTNCNNSGEIGDVLCHEWGHGLDANDGGPDKTPSNEKASGEAYGDFLGVLMLEDACIGQGIKKTAICYNCPSSCHGVRYIAMRFDDDNNPDTPDVPVTPQNIENNNGPNCDRFACPYGYRGIMGYEGHCESYIASGALWDMLQNIVSARGEAGYTWVDRIWFESIPSLGSAYRIVSGGECNPSATIDGCAASNWYTVLIGADDDDGNPSNGTPNGSSIWNAFNAHGISCGSNPGNYNICNEPSTPTLYGAASDGQIGLSWTPSSNATSYRIYINPYSTATNCTTGGWIPYITQIASYNYTTISSLFNTIGFGFAIQAINNAGDCISGMSNCVFLEPTSAALPNLTGRQNSGWNDVIVPTENSCSSTTCARSATLNPDSTNINFTVFNNTSEAAATHRNTYYVDDVEYNYQTGSTAANSAAYYLNLAFTGIKGGRHMIKLVIDSANDISESNENDNTWIAAPAIFVPYSLDNDPDHKLINTAPPDRNPQGYTYYSCDGYEFSVIPAGSSGYWGVVGMIPSSSSADYDLRLHNDYTGSSQGFGNNLKWSQYSSGGGIEFIGVNRNVSTIATWWAGVIQHSSTPANSNYAIHLDASENPILVPSSNNTGTIPGNGVIAVEEIEVGTNDLPTTWQIQVTPTGGDIGIALFSNTVEYFKINDALVIANENGENAPENIVYQFTTNGYYGLVIYKTNNSQLNNNISYTINITEAPSNLRPYTHAGWTTAVVARSSGGCNISSCIVTPTLPGWSGTTYVNSTSINDGPNPVNTSFNVRYTLDDATLEEITFASLPVGNTALDTDNTLAQTIKGGRHTIGVFTDSNNNYLENNEDDNTFYTQYVWSPYLLANNTPFGTTAPPKRTTSGGFPYYNCDGYEFNVTPSGGQSYWGVVSILPSVSTTNYDISLFDDYTGSIDGFRTPVAASNSGSGGAIELIGVNRNVSTRNIWWAGVTQGNNIPATSSYYIYKDLSGYPIDVPSSSTSGNIPSNGTANIEEIYFDSNDLTTFWTVSTTPAGGDIGIALFNSNIEYFSLADAIPGTTTNSHGSNEAESFNFQPAASGYYALVIFKPNSSQRTASIDYNISITEALSNLKPTKPLLWTWVAVPRNTTGCTDISCPLTSTLPGWSQSTYLNSATLNEGPNNITTSFTLMYTLDDKKLTPAVPISNLNANTTYYDLDNPNAYFIKGGRHTLGFHVDFDNNYSESNESDNSEYQQFVWSPMILADNTPNITSAPPDRDSTGYVFYNCDGYEFSVIPSGNSSYWGAVGMLPLVPSSNFNLGLHNDYTGSSNGFAEYVQLSNSGATGEVEIVGINRNNSSIATWWSSTVQNSNSPQGGNYTISKDSSGNPLQAPSNNINSIPTNAVVTIEEIEIEEADAGIPWTITVTPSGGDIAIALINSSAQTFKLSDAIPGTWVNANGSNQPESFTYTPTAGYYGLLIFKPDYSQAANSINITISIASPSSGVAETPDNNLIPGTPLTISKYNSSSLQLNWGHSCDYNPSITHYAIYRGTISSLSSGSYNHVPLICDSGSDNTEIISSDSDSYYYLIVPTNSTFEGGYGFDSDANPRPASSSPCLPQNRIPCP
jgi:hypothetical protein